MATHTPTKRKKSSRQEANIHPTGSFPDPKKQRLHHNVSNLINQKKELNPDYVTSAEIKHHTIEIQDCMVRFSTTQPVKNTTGVFEWKATFNHRLFDEKDDMKVAVLAKASFSVITNEKLSDYEPLSGLSDVMDDEFFFHGIVHVQTVEIVNAFRGYDYELCLLQRIIDNHARSSDLVVIKQNDSVQHICDKMKFSRLAQSVYWARNQALRQPYITEFCTCAQQDPTKQCVTDTMLSNEYLFEEDVAWTDPEHDTTDNTESKPEDIEMDSCVVSLSSEQSALNNSVYEDFTSSWSAKLNYRSQQQNIVHLATAKIWFIHLSRLLDNGWIDDIFTVFDAPCKELADLFASVISADLCDGPFKMHKEDRMNNLRVRSKKELAKPENIGLTLEKWAELMSHPSDPDEMNEGGGGNIVYLDRIEVNKQYTGDGYGRCLTQKIIDNLARVYDAVVLKPFPLQWESRSSSDFEKEKESFEEDRQKVIDVWETMWFYPFGGPQSKYWGRSEAWTHPKMEEFCKCLQYAT